MLEVLLRQAAADLARLDPFLKWWEGALSVRLQQQTLLQGWSDHLDAAHFRLRAEKLPHLDWVCSQAQRALFHALKTALFNAEMHQTLGARQAAHLDVGFQPSMERLLQDLRTYLDALGIQEGRLVLYQEPAPDLPELGELVMVQEKPGVAPVWFPVKQLLPDAWQDELSRGHRVVFPLVVGERHYGFFLYRIDEEHIEDETPLQSIAHALHLVVQAREQERQLSELVQQVERRTRQLRQEIAERVGAEEQLKAAHQALQETAQQDGLTGLFNRAALDDRLERIFMEHQITHQPVSLLLLDVDHFKLYNDHYGHRQGDECLREVAKVLRETVRHERDVVARYGGEEFAVVLPATSQVGAELAARRILGAMQARGLPHAASPVSPSVTFSIGVFTLTPQVDSVDAWVEGADQALYGAKKQGRNGYRVQGE